MVAAVSILMLSAPLLSPPYMIWLAPWAAIAWTERTGYVRWLLASLMLVGGLMLLASSAFADVALVGQGARAAPNLLVAVPVVYLLERTSAPPAARRLGSDRRRNAPEDQALGILVDQPPARVGPHPRISGPCWSRARTATSICHESKVACQPSTPAETA